MVSLRYVLVLAVFMGNPAQAATIEDPDSPRFGPGLRVLGFREEVEVVRLDEYRHLDAEPLYLARSPDREAVFREGEDLCLGKLEFGLFVACNRDLDRAASPILADEPADAPFGILSLSPSPAPLGPRHSSGGFMSGGGGSGSTPDTPRLSILAPPDPDMPAENIPPPESVTPVPMPASFWLMAGMMAAISAAVHLRRWT